MSKNVENLEFFWSKNSKIHVFYYNKTIAQQIHFFFPDPARRARSGEKNEFPVRLFYHYKKPKSSIFWGWTTPAKMSDFERFSNFKCFYCPIAFLTSFYIHSNYDFGGVRKVSGRSGKMKKSRTRKFWRKILIFIEKILIFCQYIKKYHKNIIKMI